MNNSLRTHARFLAAIVTLAIGSAIGGYGLAANAGEKPAPAGKSAIPTTSTLWGSQVTVPLTTAAPALTTTTSKPKPVQRVAPRKTEIATPVSFEREGMGEEEPTAPKGFLELAQAEVGKEGPYAEGGFFCARFVSWIAEQARIEGWESNDGPGVLYGIQRDKGNLSELPSFGALVFIDLFGNAGQSDEQVTHVGIVESFDGNTIHTIEGNVANSAAVSRQTRAIGDGFVVGFAPIG